MKSVEEAKRPANEGGEAVQQTNFYTYMPIDRSHGQDDQRKAIAMIT